MKTIAFLCCLLIGLTLRMEVNAFRDQTFETPYATLMSTRDAEGNALLTATGKHAFEVSLGCNQIKVYVTGVHYDGEYYVAYGYVHDTESTQFYDGYVGFISQTGTLVHEEILRYDTLTEVKAVYDVVGSYIYKLNHTIASQAGYEWVHHTLLMFDETQTVIKTLNVDQPIKTARIDETMIFFSDSYHGEVHSAVDQTLNLYERGILYGIANHADYEGSVEAVFIGTASLNGTPVVNRLIIDYPGHYVFEYDEYTYRFTVHPIITGVQDGVKTVEPLYIDYSGGKAFLNHDLYVSGTRIDTPGYHTLLIEGDNDYTYQVRFTITANIDGVYDGRSYDEARTITFQGNGYLNNRFVESGVTISEAGHYTLRVEGVNGYSETIHFEILDTPIENERMQALLAVEIGVLLTACITCTTLYIRHRKRKT